MDDLLDARGRDVYPGKGDREAGVAFVPGDGDLAGLGDEVIGARDTDVGVDAELPQVTAGDIPLPGVEGGLPVTRPGGNLTDLRGELVDETGV